MTPADAPQHSRSGFVAIGGARYALLQNLSDAKYEFRASSRLNGAKVGGTYLVIEEDGKTVS